MHRPLGLALLILFALPEPGFAHPELEAQIERLSEQLEVRPGDAELLLRRADLHRRHGDLGAAREDLRAAAGNSPPPEIDFYRGRLLLDAGEPGAAERAFSSYLAVQPNHVKTLTLRAAARIERGGFLEASEDLQLAITHSEHPSPGLFHRRAAVLVHAGDAHWAEARSAADEGLARFPGEVSLLGLATDIALAMNDTPAADAYMEQLPPKVGELPLWRERLNLSRELAAAGPVPAADLHARARRALLESADPH